jgi:uncharacterized protein YdhG (YjbR/CyaY superfamily)
MATKPTTPDEYLQALPDDQRAALERVREIVKAEIPDVEERITYGMPGFNYEGKYLMAYAAFKDHLSVFPGATAITGARDLENFKISKGTVQFTLEKPLPEALIRELVFLRKREIDG